MLSLFCEKYPAHNNHFNNAYEAYVAGIGLYGEL